MCFRLVARVDSSHMKVDGDAEKDPRAEANRDCADDHHSHLIGILCSDHRRVRLERRLRGIVRGRRGRAICAHAMALVRAQRAQPLTALAQVGAGHLCAIKNSDRRLAGRPAVERLRRAARGALPAASLVLVYAKPFAARRNLHCSGSLCGRGRAGERTSNGAARLHAAPVGGDDVSDAETGARLR